jgi:hypothetical protein
MISKFNFFRFSLLFYLSFLTLTHSNIIQANSTNFYTLLQQEPYTVIFFYDNPNDENTKIAKNNFEALQKDSSDHADLQFVSVNINTNRTLIEDWDLDNLPSIIFYRKLGEEFIKFKDEMNEENTKLFLYLQLDDIDDQNLNYKELNYTSQLSTRNFTKYKKLLIFIGDRNKHSNEFLITKRTVLLLGDKYQLVVSNSSKILYEFNVSLNDFGLILIKNQKKIKESPFIVTKLNPSFYEKFSVLNLQRLIKSYDFVPFQKLNEAILDKILDAKYKFLMLLFNSGYNTSEYQNKLWDFAERHRKDFWILSCEVEDKEIKKIFKYIEITTIPGAVFFSGLNRKTLTIYKYIYEGNLQASQAENQLEKFYTDYRKRKLKNHLQSENLPSNILNSFNVYKLVSKSLNPFIASVKFSIIFFVNDKMANAKMKKQRFYDISIKMKNINSMRFAEINPYYNEVDLIDMKHYPGIAIFSNQTNKLPLEFNSTSFKTLDIIGFIEKYTESNLVSQVFQSNEINALKAENDIEYEEDDTNDDDNEESNNNHHKEISKNNHEDL